MPPLSKTRYLQGLSCPKLLWTLVNAPERMPKVDAQTQFLFDQGHEVGNLAKKRYPKGIEIWKDNAVKITWARIQERQVLFEATFAYKNAYARVDILLPHGKHEWDIIEVKSSTEVKDEHLEDVGFQYYALAGAGLKIRKVFILTVDNEYVRGEKIDEDKFFKKEDVTEVAMELSDDVEATLERMQKIIAGPEPKPKLGTDCLEPKDCPLCQKDLKGVELATLFYFGKKAYPLINKGIKTFKDLPETTKLTDKQIIQIKAVETRTPHVEKKPIEQFLKLIKEPITALDFETIFPAIPVFKGTSPYEQVPTQFSAHIIKNDKVTHKEFLAQTEEDPRKTFLQALKTLPQSGTVLAFNASFERRIMEKLAEDFPGEAPWLNSLINRLEDLALPFKEFWYYHPRQKGSYSLKEVLPAMTERGYEGLTIAEGGAATRAFLSMMNDKHTEKETKKIREDLLKYCARDTEAMVEILNKLKTI